MSNYYPNEKAFKSKARLLADFLGLPPNVALQLWSKILGYADYDAARSAGMHIPELKSRLEVADRVCRVVPEIPTEKVEELVARLKLRTVDDVLAGLKGEQQRLADDAHYLVANTGALSERYHASLRELAPVFQKIHDLSLTIFERRQPAASVQTIVAGMADLSGADARAAIEILTPAHRAFPNLLPVSTSMLILQSIVRRGRIVSALSSKTLHVLNGMLELALAADGRPDDSTRSELKFYGVLFVSLQRQIGAHDTCSEVLSKLVALAALSSTRFEDCFFDFRVLRDDAAFSALFARRFGDVLRILAPCGLEGVRHTSASMSIGAVAKAQLGDKRGASQLIDFLLCDHRTRAALGFNPHHCISRRRPETMPLLESNIFDLTGDKHLEKLRFIDLQNFPDAHPLFLRRDQRLRHALQTSAFVLKGVRIFPGLCYRAKPPKGGSVFSRHPEVTPFVLRFGPGPGAEAVPAPELGVLCIRRRGMFGSDRLVNGDLKLIQFS